MRSGKTERVRVVAIGGSASVGKTTCAERVAELLGVSEVIHVDDLSKRIQDNGEPHPLETIDQPWRRPPTYLAQQLIEWTPRLHPAILEAVEQAASTGGVIEGEGIDPRLAPELASAGVAAVYVIETDPTRLHGTFRTRQSRSRFTALTSDEQDAVIEMNRLYAHWLRESAVEVGQPWVPSHPWTTLPDRIFTAVS
jgi:hypothetical protein